MAYVSTCSAQTNKTKSHIFVSHFPIVPFFQVDIGKKYSYVNLPILHLYLSYLKYNRYRYICGNDRLKIEYKWAFKFFKIFDKKEQHNILDLWAELFSKRFQISIIHFERNTRLYLPIAIKTSSIKKKKKKKRKKDERIKSYT